MRTIGLVALVLFALVARARADMLCGGSLLTPRVAQGRAQFIVEASCMDVDQTTFVLRARDGAEIPTEIVKSYVGDRDSQWVVEPTRPLDPGVYEIDVVSAIPSLLGGAPVVTTAPYFAKKLTVVTPGKLTLSWTRDPAVTSVLGDETVIEVGTTPATVAYVELVSKVSKRRQEGYVAIQGTSIAIGHRAAIGFGMVSQGMFGLVKDRDYTIAITLLAPEIPASSPVKVLSASPSGSPSRRPSPP